MRETSRPRVVVVGGGGTMGRLFARSLAPAAREIDLLDYFGAGNRPAHLAKTLDDLAAGSAAPDARVAAAALIPPVGESSEAADSPWRIGGPVDFHARAALGSLTSDAPPLDLAALAAVGRPSDLLDALAHVAPDATLIFAGQPEHAREVLPRADVVLLALGFESADSFARTLRPYVPWLRSGSVVVDLGSTKTGPMAVLEREIPPDVDVVGAHPLFGPAVTDLTGLIVAAVPPSDERPQSPWRGWFFDQLARLRMIVTPTTAAEHDDAMAFVQALTHFALLAFAYTFVRLDRDPIDLLAFRTPVFEPLLYLAARVAYLAQSNPETYRSIQAFSTRPDARTAFLEGARELLAAIETSGPNALPDRLVELFRRNGGPWSPDGRDRRERQRREHFLEMGSRLVDNLNRLRQEVVTAVGQVRAVEESRAGQPAHVVVGLVDLDLLAPGKQDVASRIRLRRLNLALGSVLAEGREDDGAQDHVIPLARARILSDGELLDWLYHTDQLVERRSVALVVPDWFDRDVLTRLLKGTVGEGNATGSQVWDVEIDCPSDPPSADPGAPVVARLNLAVVLHPAELVAARRVAIGNVAPLDAEIAATDLALDVGYAALEKASPEDRRRLSMEKDRLKRARKSLLDRRAAEVDRAVRQAARRRVGEIVDAAVRWLLAHGCTLPPRPDLGQTADR